MRDRVRKNGIEDGTFQLRPATLAFLGDVLPGHASHEGSAEADGGARSETDFMFELETDRLLFYIFLRGSKPPCDGWSRGERRGSPLDSMTKETDTIIIFRRWRWWDLLLVY